MAAIWSVAQHTIDWPRAGVMTVGALAGYYLGSHYSQRIEQRRVRQIITVIGFVLSAVTFYQAFGQAASVEHRISPARTRSSNNACRLSNANNACVSLKNSQCSASSLDSLLIHGMEISRTVFQ